MPFCPDTMKLCGMCLGFCPAHHYKHVPHALYVHAKFDRLDQVLIPVPGGRCCRQTWHHSSFIVLTVCVWRTVWRRSVWYLYIPLWCHSLCGACLSWWKRHCSRLSSFLCCLHLLYRGQRAPGGSSFIHHLRELRSFPLALFLPLHTLKSHLYRSIESQRLYPQPLTPLLCWW